jgi:hexulose-6-phosphate isomerase
VGWVSRALRALARTRWLSEPVVVVVPETNPEGVDMFAAINAWVFPEGVAPREQIAAAASAGFAGIELVVSDDGPLRFDTSPRECATLLQQAEDRGIRICGLASAEFWKINYGSPDEAVRRRAGELTLRALDRAADLKAGAVLVVPAVPCMYNEYRMQVGYADALQRTHEALSALRGEAEARRVTIAIENVWNRFLLSPVEFANLIDQVGSPFVGAYFDVGNVVAFGFPEDWIATLGERIKRVHAKDYDVGRPGLVGFCPLGEGSVAWPRVTAALRQVGYAGPLTFEGGGELEDIHRRLLSILSGAP